MVEANDFKNEKSLSEELVKRFYGIPLASTLGHLCGG